MSESERLIAQHGTGVVIEALAPILSDERRRRIEDVLAARLASLTVALENLYDPHNGAAVIRSAEAFGLCAVHAIEATTPFAVASGVTIGANKWLDVHKHPGAKQCVDGLRRRGMKLCATLPDAEATVADLDVSVPWAIAFGNEHDGLTAELVEMCDAAVSIPMVGFTRSLNLSVSAALVVSQLARRRREYLGGGDLDDATRANLRARWYFRSVRGAAEIIARHVSK